MSWISASTEVRGRGGGMGEGRGGGIGERERGRDSATQDTSVRASARACLRARVPE